MSAVGAALAVGLPPLPPALRGSGSAPLLALNELIDKERSGSIDGDGFKKEVRKLARSTKSALAKAGKEEVQQYDPMKTVLLDLEKLRKTTRYGKITERTTLPTPVRQGHTRMDKLGGNHTYDISKFLYDRPRGPTWVFSTALRLPKNAYSRI
jgi:hypothetical protein